MHIYVEGTSLVLSPSANALQVSVEKNGFDPSCLDVIARYAQFVETETGLTLNYPLSQGEMSFRDAVGRAHTRIDRLLLAQSLVACIRYRGGFEVPLIHPDNVYVQGGLVRVVHSGLQGMLVPAVFDDEQFFLSLKAMVLQVFRPKIPFEQILEGSAAFRDKFSSAIRQSTTTERLFGFIDEQLRTEQAEIAATKVRVSRRKYFWYRIVGVVGLVAALGAGVFVWQTENQNRLQTAVISAQSRFLAKDYAGTLTELEGRDTASLPVSAKYVLAVSSINLHDLTSAQKESILNSISEKSDDVTLNYWISIGRGEFDQALDYAKNLGDDQLTLLAYTDLYQATKLDTHMAGSKKQELLDKYAKAIEELSAKLDGSDEAATKK